jgi:hypothetical protein
VVSLLLRLPDFEILKDKSRTFLKVLGGTQPLIGGIFAFVLGALISARIININVGGSSDLSTWLFVVLGFLAGPARGSPEIFCMSLKAISVARRGSRRRPPGSGPNRVSPPERARGQPPYSTLSALGRSIMRGLCGVGHPGFVALPGGRTTL